MSFTYDPATPTGQVRTLIGDTDETSPYFTDEAIAGLLSLEDNEIKLAAADALDAIASTQALLQKKVKVGDISTDGPAVADALRKHAQALRAQVYDGSPAFDIVEMNLGLNALDILENGALRNG